MSLKFIRMLTGLAVQMIGNQLQGTVPLCGAIWLHEKVKNRELLLEAVLKPS